MQPHILVFAGSSRTGSLNTRLAHAAAAELQRLDARVTHIRLADYPMPLYDGDLEKREGMPEHARRLRALFEAADAFLIVSPEHNAGISALLKNAIDWISREMDGQSGLIPYRGKVAALMAASPGSAGGLRGLVQLRATLTTLQVLVLPEQLALPAAHQAFDEDGALQDERFRTLLRTVTQRLVEVTTKLRAAPSGA